MVAVCCLFASIHCNTSSCACSRWGLLDGAPRHLHRPRTCATHLLKREWMSRYQLDCVRALRPAQRRSLAASPKRTAPSATSSMSSPEQTWWCSSSLMVLRCARSLCRIVQQYHTTIQDTCMWFRGAAVEHSRSIPVIVFSFFMHSTFCVRGVVAPSTTDV
jgi:hypothetical protein